MLFKYNNTQVIFPSFLRALPIAPCSLSRGAKCSTKNCQIAAVLHQFAKYAWKWKNVNKTEILEKYKTLSEIVKNILNHGITHSNSHKYNVNVSDDRNDRKTILNPKTVKTTIKCKKLVSRQNIEGIQIWKTILWQKRK